MLDAILIVLSIVIWVGMFAYYWRADLYEWYDNHLKPHRPKTAPKSDAEPPPQD